MVPTIFVIGDSTTGLNPPSKRTGKKVSWADAFGGFVDGVHALYQNEATPGFSLRDYHHRGELNAVLLKSKPADVLLACHGHLEGAPLVRDNPRARGCLPGIGDESQVVYDHYFQREETVRTFGWYLRECFRLCRERGVTVVFLSPPVRCVWENAKIKRTQSSGRAKAMRLVSDSQGACYLDFAACTENYLNEIGESRGGSLYLARDQVHTNADGAHIYAGILARELRGKFPAIFTGLLKEPPAGGVSTEGTGAASAARP